MNIVSMAQEWLDQQSFGIGGREQREMYQSIIDGAERDLLAYMKIVGKTSQVDASEFESVTIHNQEAFNESLKSVEARLKQKLFRDD